MPKHLTHAQIMAQLDPSDPATIQRLIDHRRAHFGDARMEADATSDDTQETPDGGEGEQPEGDERLGEGGKKALQAEREARAAEKRRADAAEARLKELDDAKLTDQQRLEAERDEDPGQGGRQHRQRTLGGAERSALASGVAVEFQLFRLCELESQRPTVDVLHGPWRRRRSVHAVA